MMPIKLEAVPVIVLYGLALFVILYVAPRVSPELLGRGPWWRSVRFWASFVAVTQIVVYALFS